MFSPGDFGAAISSGDIAALTRVPGIGAKGAQRMVLELKDKVAILGDSARPGAAPVSGQTWREQVHDALEGLGYSARDADTACERVAEMATANPDLSVAELLRAALRSLAK